MGSNEARPHAEMETALLDALLEQRHMAVGVCDSDGVLAMTSPAMQVLLGAAYAPVPEAAWSATYYLHDEYGTPLPPRGDPLSRALQGEPVVNEVLSVRRPGEPVRWGVASGLRLRDGQQNTVGAALFVLDVTERTLEQQRLDQLRDRLVETVNHEVRTPIAKIQGHLELMEEAPDLPPTVLWSLTAIRRGADRLAEVAVTISDLAEQAQSEERPH